MVRQPKVPSADLPSLAKVAWLNDGRLQEVMSTFMLAGGEVRIIGGAVRNTLLDLPVADIDLATTLEPQEVVRIASQEKFGVHLTGFDHGTVTVVNGGGVYQVTSLRRDVATDGRRAVVAYSTDWAEDAHRRDFTMNALSCDAMGRCYDYTSGYADILKRKVRFVGVAAQRIAEDYLRILRFFRFHATFGVGAPDRAGVAACEAQAQGIKSLSAERVRQELLKLLVAPRAVATLKVMAKRGILAHVIEYTNVWRVLERLPRDGILRLFVLAQMPNQLAVDLRLSNAEAKRLAALTVAPALSPDFNLHERKVLLYSMGADCWRDAVHLGWAKAREKSADAAWQALLDLPKNWPIPVFPVKGLDLRSLGHVSGPRMGVLLRELEDWWLASDFKPGKEELLQRVKVEDGK